MSKKKNHFVIILAAGLGKRMLSDDLKQFFILGDRPLLMHSLRAFYDFDSSSNISIVLPRNKIKYWKKIYKTYDCKIPHNIFYGGKNRYFSVKNAIINLKINKDDMVSIHDGVRPFITKNLIKNVFDAAIKKGHAAPMLYSKDSIRVYINNTLKTKSVNRSNFIFTQTPQIFKGSLIIDAYNQKAKNVTDDISLIENLVEEINLVPGEEDNIKITTQKDWEIAQKLIKSK